MNRAAYYNEMDPYAAQWLRNLIAAGRIAAGDVDERSVVDVRPDDLRGYTQCHFFAGIGVWSHALRNAGWPDDRPVWTGSCPCQPFSSAGAGAGFTDERHLWPAFFHLIQECKPAVVFGEQVASKDANLWIDLVQTDLEAVGYGVGAIAFPAAGVGAPHIRDRLYWVADAEGAGKLGIIRDARGESAVELRSQQERVKYDCGGWLGGMAYASGERVRAEGLGATGEATQGMRGTDGEWERFWPNAGAGSTNGADRMADADIVRWREGVADTRRMQCGNHAQGPVGRSTINGGLDDAGRPSPTNGYWRDADWLYCRDGKWRPVEPGTFPLVDGAAFRMGSGCADWEGKSRAGMLKAYGNAIVPQVAAAVIGAFMEYAP